MGRGEGRGDRDEAKKTGPGARCLLRAGHGIRDTCGPGTHMSRPLWPGFDTSYQPTTLLPWTADSGVCSWVGCRQVVKDTSGGCGTAFDVRPAPAACAPARHCAEHPPGRVAHAVPLMPCRRWSSCRRSSKASRFFSGTGTRASTPCFVLGPRSVPDRYWPALHAVLPGSSTSSSRPRSRSSTPSPRSARPPLESVNRAPCHAGRSRCLVRHARRPQKPLTPAQWAADPASTAAPAAAAAATSAAGAPPAGLDPAPSAS